MSVKENKDLVRRYLSSDASEIKADLAGKDDYHAPGFTLHLPTEDMKLKEYYQFMLSVIAAFPDLKYSVEDIIAEKDKVVARYSERGTHTGTAFQGIPPTGRKFKTEGIGIFRVAGDRLVEAWFASDMLGMMQQLGAIPAGPPKK